MRVVRNLRCVEAVSGWVYDHGIGHAAERRGPVLYETICGRSISGPLSPYQPPKICRECRRLVEAGRLEPDRPAAPVETQGRLW